MSAVNKIIKTLLDSPFKIVQVIIVVCLVLITFRLYTFSILDVVPPYSEIIKLIEKDSKQLEKLSTLFSIISGGINRAGTIGVEVEGGSIEVDGGSVDVSGSVDVLGEVDCYIVNK